MNSFEEIFNLMKQSLDITDIARKSWIEPIKPLKLNNNVATLYVKAPFVKQILQENYTELFKKSLKEILGFDVEVVIHCDEDLKNLQDLPPEQRALLNPITELQDDQNLVNRLIEMESSGNYNYTFDTFIEGASNKLAYAACKSVALGQKNYNPLYIYGDPGLGKTHLLSAVGNDISEKLPEMKIVFMSALQFVDDFVKSIIYEHTAIEFRNKFHNIDMLLIDDVQFFSGKKESQQMLFTIFNELHSNQKQIIFTSDRPPKEINDIEDRLRSRFEWGLLADISTPEFETRVAITERKANLTGLTLKPHIINYIAEKLKTNIRQLEGAIVKMNALSMVTEVAPTLEMAKDIVKEILDENIPTPMTIDKVINEVASIYGITSEEIRSDRRTANISTARQIAIFVVHKITGLSYAEIGKEFGGRDHSTIVYAVNKVKKIIQKDKAYRNTIDDLVNNIGNL